MKIAKTILGLTSLALLTACGSDKSSVESGAAGGDLTSAISSISAGVAATGAGMTSADPAVLKTGAIVQLKSSLCDEHGQPYDPADTDPSDGTSSLPQTDPLYPFAHTYCALTVSDGDTVKGGFQLAQGLICSLEKGGIQFNGQAQDITVSLSDTDCWPEGGPGGDGPTSATISATGTAPAEFNNYFEKGVVFTVADFGLTLKIAANIDGVKKEFIAYEEWSDGNKGVMSGSIDTSNGDLRFEKRDERIGSSCGNSSCGWNRHTRIAATLEMVNGEPKDLVNLSYGWSDIQNNDQGYGGRLITASGDLTNGIKAKFFSPVAAESYDSLKNVASWAEEAGASGCVTNAGYDYAGTCTDDGIDLFTSSAKFILHSTDEHVAPQAWLTGFAGFNFTEVNLDDDIAYVMNPVK